MRDLETLKRADANLVLLNLMFLSLAAEAVLEEFSACFVARLPASGAL
jgi:hypothetical protein